MATTIADIKKAASTAKRPSYEINASTMTNRNALRAWLRDIMVLEARVRRYAQEHGVEVTA